MKPILRTVSLLVWSAKLFAQSLAPADYWNKLIETTNALNDDKFRYTIAVVHTPQTQKLLECAERVRATYNNGMHALKSLDAANPDYSETNQAFQNMLNRSYADFNCEERISRLKGISVISDRQLLLELKADDLAGAMDSSAKIQKRTWNKYYRKFKENLIKREKEDSSSIRTTENHNQAIRYKRKISIYILSWDVYYSDCLSAINSDNCDSLVMGLKGLKTALYSAKNQINLLGKYQQDRQLFDRASALTNLAILLAENEIPKLVDLKRKINNKSITSAEMEKHNAVIKLMNEKFNPLKSAYYLSESDFLKRYIPNTL